MDKRSKAISRVAVICTLALCGAGCPGCKPSARAVDGRVTLSGQPLDQAAIVFVPLESGRKKTGAQIVAGKYQLPREIGLTPGSYRVEIVDNPPLGDPHSRKSKSSEANGVPPRRVLPYIYAHDSPLTVAIEAEGASTFDFDLKDRP